MGYDQYNEPSDDLSNETKTFIRMISSLIEEAEAIDWYEQRIAVEQNMDAVAILREAQKEECKHFGMDLEFLLRQKNEWKIILENILFKSGDIVQNGNVAEGKIES